MKAILLLAVLAALALVACKGASGLPGPQGSAAPSAYALVLQGCEQKTFSGYYRNESKFEPTIVVTQDEKGLWGLAFFCEDYTAFAPLEGAEIVTR